MLPESASPGDAVMAASPTASANERAGEGPGAAAVVSGSGSSGALAPQYVQARAAGQVDLAAAISNSTSSVFDSAAVRNVNLGLQMPELSRVGVRTLNSRWQMPELPPLQMPELPLAGSMKRTCSSSWLRLGVFR